jgi:predicted transcriptional regulator
MSPRAAWRLEQLGFAEVYDYVPGKSDWTAAGLPREGASADIPQAGDVADRKVPTCGPGEPLGDVLDRLPAGQDGLCVVVNEANVVLGTLYLRHGDDLRRAARNGATVEQAMRPGPSAVRANEQVEPLVQRLRDADVRRVLVTDPEGRLIGLFDRQRVEQTAQPR